jgi:hypothetical protein
MLMLFTLHRRSNMEAGRITGGSVSFMKRLNKGNYEHEEASTKVDFVVHEGAGHDEMMNVVEAAAKSSVLAQLGVLARPLASAPVSVQATAAQAPADGKTPKPAHRKSAQIEALDNAPSLANSAPPSAVSSATATVAAGTPVASGVSDDPLAPAGAGTPTAPRTDAAPLSAATAGSTDDPLVPASAASTPTGTAAASEDPLAPAGGLDTTVSSASTADPFTAQREVTDADLATAAAKKNEALVKVHKEAGTMKIRDLVGQFLPPGKTLRDLAQADRPAFLAELEALS